MRRTSLVMMIFVVVSVLAVASWAHAALFIRFGGIEGESVVRVITINEGNIFKINEG